MYTNYAARAAVAQHMSKLCQAQTAMQTERWLKPHPAGPPYNKLKEKICQLSHCTHFQRKGENPPKILAMSYFSGEPTFENYFIFLLVIKGMRNHFFINFVVLLKQ
jgi:hypothetical protein